MTEGKVLKIRKIEEIDVQESVQKKFKHQPKLNTDDEYHYCLKNKETCSLLNKMVQQNDQKKLEKHSYVTNDRIVVVEWLSEVCDYFNVSNVCLHLSVIYLDRIIYKHQIARHLLQVTAAVCLYIAIKKEEIDEKVPSLENMLEVTENSCTKEFFIKFELFVLNSLEWSLSGVAPCHFLEVFLPHSLSKEELLSLGEEAQQKLEELTSKFLKLWLACMFFYFFNFFRS
jgi:hypothetical protein